MRLLVISGSLRRDSHNSMLLRAAAQQARQLDDVEVVLYDGLGQLPIYDADLENVAELPEAVLQLHEQLRAADALLIATPEYNSSIPGGLKNLVDWGSRPTAQAPLRNLPVVVIGASTGMFGAVWAQDHLRQALARAGARVLDFEQIAVAHADERLAAGVDDELRSELAEALSQLQRAVSQRRELALAAA